MKAQILKLGGVTTEAEFYKKYPTEKAFMAKHGKKLEKLKKAQGGESLIPGLEGTGGMPNTSFVNSKGQLDNLSGKVSKSDATSLGYGTNAPVSDDGKKGFDYGKLAGAVIGAEQDRQANSIYNKKLDQYLDLSKMLGAIKPEKEPKPDYIRPETQLVTGATPKGIPAKNGAMIGGNPTEIQNMYTSGDIYTDLGYTNPKQYGWGGELANINAGWNNDGVIGNKSPTWQAASRATQHIPGVGLVVDFMGQTEANEQAGMIAKKRTPFFNTLAATALQNVNAGQFSANLKYGGSIDSMEKGGWVSNDWMPQVITTFGEHKLKDLLKPPHDADMLRAGGHLKQYTPPSAEAMKTFGEGGELQTLWGGGIKDGGTNPYLGPLGILSGTYHKKPAPDAPGKQGIGVRLGPNGEAIEAQTREGVVMLANGGQIDPETGGPDKSAYIFGAEKIRGWAIKAIEDDNIKKDITYQNYFKQKSELQKKLNKQELDVTEQLANLKVFTSDDKLKMNALMRMKQGIDMQNKDIARHIANAAAVQTAINETDEEMGTAKYGGKLKKAAFGAKMTTAATGANLSGLDPDVSGLINLLKRKGYDLQVTSGLRKGAKTKSGNDSRHGSGEAADVQFPKLGSKAYEALTKDADIVKYMMDKGLTAINEYDPKIRRQTGGSGPHVHFGKDSGTGLADRFRNAVGSTYKSIKDAAGIASDFISDNFGTPQAKKNASDLYMKPKARRADLNAPRKVPVYKQPLYVNTPPQSAVPVTQPPVFDALDLEVNRRNQALLAPKKVANTAVFPSPIDNEGNYFMPNSEYEAIQTSPEYQTSVASNSGFPSPMNEQGNYYMPDSEYTPIEQQASRQGQRQVDEVGNTTVYDAINKQWLPDSEYLKLYNYDGSPKQQSAQQASTSVDIPTIKDAGSFNQYGEWVPDWKSMSNQAKKLGANKVKTDQGSLINFDDNWEVTGADDSNTMSEPQFQQISSSSSQAVKPASKFSKGLERVGNNLLTGLESALPYLRPSNQRPMDPEAFTGEMFALATNQLEPVKAQKFVPYLTQGIQISLQDQMNEVTAQTRAAERMARGNPEALAMIAAQAYDAKNKIKGEEFRLNQGEKQRVAETNRQVLNEANKMNLGIMDEQYVRQQTAKSKTKEQARVALSSISDKILKNKFENKELGIYENLYGFRFGPNGQAYNTNLTTFNTPNVGQGATSLNDLTPLEKKKVLDDARKAKTTQTATAGQGGIVKSMHEL